MKNEMKMGNLNNPTLPKCRKCGAVIYDQNQTGELAQKLIAQYKLEGVWYAYPVHSCAIIASHCGVQTFITLAFCRDGKTWTIGWIGEGFASDEERNKEFDKLFPPSEGDIWVEDSPRVEQMGTPCSEWN